MSARSLQNYKHHRSLDFVYMSQAVVLLLVLLLAVVSFFAGSLAVPLLQTGLLLLTLANLVIFYKVRHYPLTLQDRIIRLEDGRYPPLGVTVTDKATGRDIGLVADDGFVYLSGIQENSILTLKWNDNVCDLTPPNHSNLDGQAIILPCKPAH